MRTVVSALFSQKVLSFDIRDLTILKLRDEKRSTQLELIGAGLLSFADEASGCPCVRVPSVCPIITLLGVFRRFLEAVEHDPSEGQSRTSLVWKGSLRDACDMRNA
jgi:hypothetical protein